MRMWPLDHDVVALPDGRSVRCRGLRYPATFDCDPDVGFYLLGHEPPKMAWSTCWIKWPDFRLPVNVDEALLLLVQAYDRALVERVEIACGGGKGRTGTALGVLAILGGVEPKEAVSWVRSAYHPRAVETPWQRRFVERLTHERIRGGSSPTIRRAEAGC